MAKIRVLLRGQQNIPIETKFGK